MEPVRDGAGKIVPGQFFCPACDGAGLNVIDEDRSEECPECKGDGVVISENTQQ